MTSEEQEEYNRGNLTNEFKDEYSFDDYNNTTQKVHTETDITKNTTVVSTYDKTRLSTQTENDNVITYTYDDSGNMATKTAVNGELSATTEFSYDTFDRTESITLGNGVTTSFAYNTDSDRISKTTGTKTTETVLDNGSVCADLVSGNNALTTKVFSGDNSIYCENGVFTYNVINSKGDLVSTVGSNDVDFRYNAYGIKLSEIAKDSNNNTVTTVEPTNPIGYRNYYYDSETGLYYLKARYYDPATGQFTQEDTVQDDNLQYNLYGYCSGNPILYTDPSGHTLIIAKMNTKQQKRIFNALDKITNDRIWYQERKDGSLKVYMYGRPLVDTTPKSDNLMTYLMGSTQYKCTIYRTTGGNYETDDNSQNAINGVGSNTKVKLSLTKNVDTIYVSLPSYKDGSFDFASDIIGYPNTIAESLADFCGTKFLAN